MAERTPRRRARSQPVPSVEVEYLMTADNAEALNGKLYLMGGGWDRIQASSLDKVPITFAFGILVPWARTDEAHDVVVSLVDADGNLLLPPLSLGVKAGRSPTMVNGADTHIPFAVKADFSFPGPGSYSLVAHIAGREEARRTFRFDVQQLAGIQTPT